MGEGGRRRKGEGKRGFRRTSLADQRWGNQEGVRGAITLLLRKEVMSSPRQTSGTPLAALWQPRRGRLGVGSRRGRGVVMWPADAQ